MNHSPSDDQNSIEITLIVSADPLTKSYGINADGVPQVSKHPFLASGMAHRARYHADTFVAEFPQLLQDLDTHDCIVLGVMSDDVVGDIADITTKERHRPTEAGDGSPLIYRGKHWLEYRVGKPGVLGLDHDAKDLPSNLRERVQANGGAMSVLQSICPALVDAASVSRPSSSTGIIAVDTGGTSAGGAWHFYVPILDGGDAADFVSRLHGRLVLEGYGYAFVSDAGAVQIRSLVDAAASGVGERLWFEANAVLGDGLAHVAGARDPVATPGGMLDTRSALAPLTAEETDRLRGLQAELRAGVADEAALKRQSHAGRVREQIVQRGEDEASTADLVERLLDADARGVLSGRHLLHLDDGRIVSVADILADRAAFHGVTCADPLEPGARNKAIVYTDGFRARLFSHAHGGRLYDLALDELDLIGSLNAAKEVGGDAAKHARRLAPDVIFASGGWSQVESATGWRVADAPDVSALDIATVAGPQEAVVQPTVGTELVPIGSANAGSVVPIVSEPLDLDPAIDLLMREYNERFAVVAEGGSTSVVRLAYNAELHRRMPVSMSLDAFKLLYGNRWIEVPSATLAGVKQVSAAALWLRHSERRTCADGFGIDPSGNLPASCYNLWQGYGVEPRQGDWSRLSRMIYRVLAAGNEDHFWYIINWLAHLVQRPDESPGVALVFRGDEGTGKGTLGRAIMRLMRPHAMQITHAKHFTGAFNAHMRTVLFLFADEAFFAGDRANEGALKGLITEDFRVNEGKGRDATLGRNRIHLMMASNNDWVVPAGANARRFAVFDVSSIHRQDFEYFAAVNGEMDTDGEGAGISAMLYDLLRYPLDINLVRKAPETSGLHFLNRISSLRGPAKWLFEPAN